MTSNDTTNPKDSIGRTKAPLSLVPVTAIKEAALAFFLGKTKYGRSNWRATPVSAKVYFDAMLRHAYRWWEGCDTDPEDGTPELGNAIACLAILIDARVCGTLIDDRQFRGANAAAHISSGLGVMADLEAKYGHMQPKDYTIADTVTLKVSPSTPDLRSTIVEEGLTFTLSDGSVPFAGGKP